MVLRFMLCCAVLAGAAALVGCSAGGQGGKGGSASKETTDTRKGYGMGGVEQDIAVYRQTIEKKPAPWDLSTPESAVRSYLDWVSYAYRIGESDVATATMTPYQLVRFDAYNQMNLQKKQLIDQKLDSITFGKATKTSKGMKVPAQEKWTYRYVSVEKAGQTLEGPYKAEYNTTYTVVKQKGKWLVDDIEVKAVGEVK